MTPPPARLRPPRQEEAIIEAAWCYYHDNMNQNDIADRLGLSRATVVNYLQEARKRDYVRVTLDSEVFRNHHLARALVDRFGLSDAIVLPADPLGPRGSFDRVTRAAADWLPGLLGPGDRLGVAWGETVMCVAEAAPRVQIPGLTVVQLVGSRPAAPGFAAETCSAILAHRFGAHCINLHVPLLLSDAAVADLLRQEPVIARQLEAVAQCNKTVFACGTFGRDSHIVQTGLIAPDEIAAFSARGARGVICGRLIDADGQAVANPVESRMIGVTLDQMRGKDMALMVGAGPDRVAPMRAAIAGGYASHVATCSDTATALLEDLP